MILHINTIKENDQMEIILMGEKKIISRQILKAKRSQAEKLIPAIDKLLKDGHVKLSDLSEVKVENRGGSFTSLRIGVITANALAYALGIKVSGSGRKRKLNTEKKNKFEIVAPVYGGEPNISKSKKVLL